LSYLIAVTAFFTDIRFIDNHSTDSLFTDSPFDRKPFDRQKLPTGLFNDTLLTYKN
jgi:hypothetical protein